MGMTRTQKIMAKHAGRDHVEEGELLISQVDLTLANDITGPPAIDEFDKIGKPVFDKNKVVLVPDHFSPPKDIKSAEMCKHMRDFARAHEIKNYFEVGHMGIEHALLPDSGLVAPGEIIIGADSLFAFDEWMEPERICRACTLVVAVRDHASYAELNREIQRLSARYNGNFALLDTMNIDVSSHQIRQWISEEKSLKYYVPDKVISYMKENGIYRKKEV